MKHITKLTLLLAAVLLPVACEPDGRFSLDNERDIVYTVAEQTTTVHLKTEAEWQQLLDRFCDYAEGGSTVTFRNANKQSKGLAAKDATTYSTTDREAMKRWMAQMEDEGKTVTVSYDEGSGTWNGTAYATAPQPQEDSGPFDSIGATRSLFSIGAGRQVRFSRGNLQYHAGNDIWRFALQQQDCLVLANTDASDSCNGWIDLFGWGSTGYDGKMPWAMSMDDSCYADGMQSIAGTHHDWGVHCAIENGGNEAGLWRLLTRTEARYLLEVRTASTVAGVENARHVRGKVNGIHGLIIFPDSYVHPDSVALPMGVNNNGLSSAEGWNDNDYSEADWALMEQAGAVFLPAAGYRVGTIVIDDDITGDRDGRYWTSTLQHTGNASALIASPREVGTTGMEIHDGLAVRLVKEN